MTEEVASTFHLRIGGPLPFNTRTKITGFVNNSAGCIVVHFMEKKAICVRGSYKQRRQDLTPDKEKR